MEAVAARAEEHRRTLMMGRTHGVHAEVTTFGLKLAVWYDEMRRNRERMRRAAETVRVGKISGAVGTFAHLDPDVEETVCRRLGLEAARASTQTLQRDRHAEYLCTLAIIGSSLDKFATEIRHLQRTEVREVEEPFAAGQKGSSAMPHKRNPVKCEQISGLSRLLRGYAVTALENMPLWHERDISHSSAERVILPDATGLLCYMLRSMTRIVKGLQVYPERMLKNMELTRGLAYSGQLLLDLTRKGRLPRRRLCLGAALLDAGVERGQGFSADLEGRSRHHTSAHYRGNPGGSESGPATQKCCGNFPEGLRALIRANRTTKTSKTSKHRQVILRGLGGLRGLIRQGPCFPASMPVKSMVLKYFCRRWIDHEEDVSAEQRQAEKDPWVSGQDGD